MSKLNLNKNNSEFYKRGIALTVAGIMAVSGFFIASNLKKKDVEKNTNETVFVSPEENDIRNEELKKHIKENIDSLEVILDYNNISYYITETSYKETPVYDVNEMGVSYVKCFSKEPQSYKYYTVSFELAKKLGIEDLLETKVIGSGSMVR